MIRKLSAFLILAFIGWGYLQAQEAKTCFKNMPDSICPLLSAVNRADFIDFLESKMKAEVTNSFGGKSEMTEAGKPENGRTEERGIPGGDRLVEERLLDPERGEAHGKGRFDDTTSKKRLH